MFSRAHRTASPIGIVCAVAALGPLTACASGPAQRPGPTPFVAAGAQLYGYTDQRIEADRFRVTFQGNTRTSRQQVDDSLLLRAAQLTIDNGYDWFQTVNRATDEDRFRTAFPSSFGPAFASYTVFHPRFGWVRVRDPFAFDRFGWNDWDYRETFRYEATAEIVLGRGAKPEGRADAFNARDVLANLGPRLIPPAPAPGPATAPASGTQAAPAPLRP